MVDPLALSGSFRAESSSAVRVLQGTFHLYDAAVFDVAVKATLAAGVAYGADGFADGYPCHLARDLPLDQFLKVVHVTSVL
jgi:hypothetical protein